MGVNQVFKQGRTEKASEIIGDSGLGATNKRKGPIVDNKDSSRFAALDLEGLSREFAEGFEGIGNIRSDVSDSEILQNIDMFVSVKKYVHVLIKVFSG